MTCRLAAALAASALHSLVGYAMPSSPAGCFPAITVTSDADAGAGTLRQAIADVCPGGVIDFDLPLPATISLTTGMLRLDAPVTIQGPGAERLAVRDSGGGRVLAVSAAAVYVRGLTIADGHVSRGEMGGAIYTTGTLELSGIVLVNNSADGHIPEGRGGAVFNSGTLVVRDTVFRDNEVHGAAIGAALYNRGGDVTLDRCTLSGNRAFSQAVNYASAGIFNESGVVRIVNCTFSGNESSASTAVTNIGGTTSISHSTFANNVGETTRILVNLGGRIVVRNSIVAGNAVPENCDGDIESDGYNLSDDATCAFVDPSDRIVDDARLSVLAVIDAGVPTHALLSGSPALDAGVCTDAAGHPVTSDARGLTRPVDGPDLPNAVDGCDVGAHENQAAQLAPAKTLEAPPVPGTDTAYLISVINDGVLTTTSAVVIDVLPPEVTLAGPVTLDPPQPDAILAQDASDLPLIGSHITIAHAQTITLRVPVTVRADLEIGHAISNTATATSDESLAPHATTHTASTCLLPVPVTSDADDGPGSLRDAIRVSCPGTTITFGFAQPTTISLTSGALFVDKTLRIVGPGAELLALSGQRRSRVLEVPETGVVHVEGLTLRDGRKFDYGGGILNQGELELVSVAVTDNAGDNGGGIATFGKLTVSLSQIRGNVAQDSGCQAIGGGIYASLAEIDIRDSLIADNLAACGTSIADDGGGIYATDSTLSISRTAIVGNEADIGAAISLGFDMVVRISNSTIAENRTPEPDNWIVSLPGDDNDVAIESSTIANNDGIGMETASLYPVTVRNTIVAGNSTGDCDGNGIVSLGYNLSGDESCQFTDPTDLPGVDPQLLALDDYGGATPTLALSPGSPAIDAGACTTGMGEPVVDDQRGVARPAGAGCDIGAYEHVPLVERVDYRFRMNDGSSGSGRYTLLADRTFVDESNRTGSWAFQPAAGSLTLRYGPGLACEALSLGRLISADALQGPRVCRDGSGVRGTWVGEIL